MTPARFEVDTGLIPYILLRSTPGTFPVTCMSLVHAIVLAALLSRGRRTSSPHRKTKHNTAVYGHTAARAFEVDAGMSSYIVVRSTPVYIP